MLLDQAFVEGYRSIAPRWGFPSGPNSLGELVYRRTYRRGVSDWVDTLQRATEGTFEILQGHCEQHGLPFDTDIARQDAREFFSRMFHFKWTPPGRGLWMMGTDFIRMRGSMALQSCAYVTTEFIDLELDKPFRFLMDVSMLGTGCGFDTKGAGKLKWQPSRAKAHHPIPDSREGWVESVGTLLRWGFGCGPEPEFDYSLIRPAGTPIKGFGGVSEGPEALKKLHAQLGALIASRKQKRISVRDIADIMNMIGACVVAGNVRRTAEICFGDPDDEDFLDLKDYDRNPDRADFGWTSNNSVFARLGMDYSKPAGRTGKKGEPGYAWLENMRAYGRMCDPPNHKDRRVKGGNPCLEQSLEHYEVCTLVETYPHHHESIEDYRKTLKYAFLYAKAVTLVPTHWKETNAVVMRNRRIGCSISGVAQFVAARGKDALSGWLDDGYRTVCHYDTAYSEWLGVRESIKKTSVKPSGTVSLLAGATPGCHWPERECYIRRVRYAASHPDLAAIREAGYRVETSVTDAKTMVAEFPVKGPEGVPTQDRIPLKEKVAMAVFLQSVWADNQVSCTATFDPATEAEQIEGLLKENDKRLKGISFLPNTPEGAYEQMPYEAISPEEYERRIAGIKRIVWPTDTVSHEEQDSFCDGQACELKGGAA